MKTKLLLSTLAASSSLYAANDMSHATNSLGLELYKKLNKSNKNLCISPHSLQSVLSMTANGAAGETLNEMRRALKHTTSLNRFNKSYATYAKKLEKRLGAKVPKYIRAEQPSLYVVNRIFSQQDGKYEKNFLKVLKKKYKAPLETLDFKNQAEPSRKYINKWVSKQTKEKIQNLLPSGSITPLTKMVLANCVHFKSGWKMPFEKHETKAETFYCGSGQKVKADTMHKTAKYGYHKASNFEAVSLPYGYRGDLQFLIILPNKGKKLNSVMAKIGASQLTNLAGLQETSVSLSLPKFKISEGSYNLNKPLQEMGMRLAFDSSKADFSQISKVESLYISAVFQKTFIEVDEKGTEAAAASAAVVAMKMMPAKDPDSIVVKVNRPFFYAIQDTKTGNCLFMGNVQELK